MLVNEYDVEAWYLIPIKEYEQNPSGADKLRLPEVFQHRYDACTFIIKIGEYLRL